MQQADQKASEPPTAEAIKVNTLFERLPPWVVDSLSTEQRQAIHAALIEPTWKLHPINIRVSVPFLHRRYYVTVVGGEEKRSLERRRHDRHKYPLRTVANVFFMLGLGTIFYVAAILALALFSAVIEI